ncbi:angiogenesis [Mactra antiquata]
MSPLNYCLVVMVMVVAPPCSPDCDQVMALEIPISGSLKYNSCDDVLQSGHHNESGNYYVLLNTSKPTEVICRFENKIAYTSIMQQKYGRENFHRGWNDYVLGFGYPASGDFWSGLRTIRALTDSGHRVLTVTMQDWRNEIKIIQYRFFELDNTYRLRIGSYVSGHVLPDDFFHNNDQLFATYDRPDINNCAGEQRAGWWFNYCTLVLPTGQYYVGGPYTPAGRFYDGIYYKDWLGFDYSLKYIKLELSYS